MMTADPEAHGLDVRRANRRGFVMGVTLAELMLIVLFALLLLLQGFGQIEEDLGGKASVDSVLAIIDSVETWAGQRGQTLPQVWSTLIPKVDGSPADMADENRALEARVADLERQLAEKSEELVTARAEVDETLEQNQALKAEVVEAKEGGLVLCAYEPPSNVRQVRGTSVSLGTMHLQADGITLIHKRPGLRGLDVVDYVGDRYDLGDAVDLLDSWPVGDKLTFEEFSTHAAGFVQIGEREAERRQKCRFSMGYYIDDGVTPYVLTGIFEQYFLKQPVNSISREEYERLLRGR